MNTTVSAVMVLLACGACGGQTATSASDAGILTYDAAPATTLEGACGAQSAAACAKRDTCTGGIGNQIDYGSASLCQSLVTAQCIAGLAARDTATTLAHLNGCLAAYEVETCTEWADDDPPVACRSPMGTRASGTACGEGSQCGSGFCLIGENTECGTCQPMPQVGAPCTNESSCGYSLACAFDVPATSGTCTAWGGVGTSCDSLHQCQGGLGCVGASSETGASGTCQTGAAEGAACNNESGPACNGSLDLDCIDGTCQRQALVGPGSPCGEQANGAYNRCSGGAACVTPLGPCQLDTGASCDGTMGGKCVAPAANSAPCDTLKGPLCQVPAKCVRTSDAGTAGTCLAPDPASCG
jgi:hypothetical protein